MCLFRGSVLGVAVLHFADTSDRRHRKNNRRKTSENYCRDDGEPERNTILPI